MYEIAQLVVDFCSQNKRLTAMHAIIIVLIPLRDIMLPLQYTSLITSMQNSTPITTPLLYVVVTLVCIQILDLLSDYCDTYILTKLQAFVRQRLLVNLFDKYERSIADIQTGEITTKMIKLPQVITILFERLNAFFIPHFMLHIGACILMTYVDWQLGLAMFLASSIFYTILIWSAVRCDTLAVMRDKTFSALHEDIDDILRNLFSVYGGNQAEHEMERVAQIASKYDDIHRTATVCAFRLRSLIYPVMIAFMLFVMLRATHLIARNKQRIQKVIPIFFVLMCLINSYMSFDDNIKHIVLEWGVLASGKELLKRPRKGNPVVRALPPESPRDITSQTGIGLHNVNFRYPSSRNNDKLSLENISLHVQHGETVAILGEVGSGKSTILKLLMGYYHPTDGHVYYDGIPYDEWDPSELRRHIGYVPQTPILFNRSIYDNITYGQQHVLREHVQTLLQDLGLQDTFSKLPNGLDTFVGKSGSHLSGGQRQLVWCARVILQNPDVIILDEPTASMDAQSKVELKRILWRYFVQLGKTVIMVTHDDDLATFASRFITVENGRII